jgi:hypothetical protein
VSACVEEYDGSTWATAAALNNGRRGLSAAGHVQDNVIVAGGQTPSTVSCIEEYNGVSWSTSVVSLSGARYDMGDAGTGTAAIFAGGSPNTSLVQQYNSETVYANLTCCTRCLDATCTQL